MMRISKEYWSMVLGVVFSALISLPLYAAEEIIPPMSYDEMTHRSIRDQVRVLRQARFEKMPYLSRGFIRSEFDENGVQDKMRFISGDKKNLESLIERAIQVSTLARATREGISLSKRRILVALRELFPAISFEFQHRDGSLSATPFNSRDWRWSFRQPLFHGGALMNTLFQEKAGLEASEKEYDKVIGDLINDVSAAYFEYNRAMEILQDRQSAIQRTSHFVSISEQKWEAEIISEIQHLNVQSISSRMRDDYESAKQDMELAKLELQRLLDLEIYDRMDVMTLYGVENLIERDTLPGERESLIEPSVGEEVESGIAKGTEVPNLEVLVDLAYQNRPELQVEAAKLQSARLEEKIKWGGLLPQLDLVMEFGKLGEAFNEDSLDPKMRKEFRLFLEISWNAAGSKVEYSFENDSRAPSVTQFQAGTGTQITRNSFKTEFFESDSLNELVDIKDAEVDRLEQVVELEKAEKEIIHDVKKAYFDYQRGLIQVKSALRRVVYHNRLVVLARHRLENNEIEVSEYLQAEMELLQHRVELHNALKDYFKAKAELNRAVGMRDFLPIEEFYER